MCINYLQGKLEIAGKPPMLVLFATGDTIFVESLKWMRCLKGDITSNTIQIFCKKAEHIVKDTISHLWPEITEPYVLPSYRCPQHEGKLPFSLEFRMFNLRAGIAMIHCIATSKNKRWGNLPTLCKFLHRLFEKLGGHVCTFKVKVAGADRDVHLGSDGSVPCNAFWDAFFFEFHGASKLWDDMSKQLPPNCLPFSDAGTLALGPGRTRLVDVFTFLSDPMVHSEFPQFLALYENLLKQVCQFMYDKAYAITSEWTDAVKTAWCLPQHARFAQQWILQQSVRDGKAGMTQITINSCF